MEKFDFENEGNLSNTISVFNQLLFTDANKQKVSLQLHDIDNIIPHAKAGLANLYDLKPKYREEIYNWLEYHFKETKRIMEQNELSYLEKRRDLLFIFWNIINEIFKNPIQETSITKLKVNAPANVVYNLIKQLKPICIQDELPFLPQTNKQIAEFLISCVEGFENLSINTVTTEIGREQNIMKTSISVKKRN